MELLQNLGLKRLKFQIKLKRELLAITNIFFSPLKIPKIVLKILLTGVRIKKYINIITTGAIIMPKISPNLIQNLLSGVNIFELIKPSIKKIVEIPKKTILKFVPFFKGHRPIIKNTIKNNKPKLLFEF